MKLLVVTPEPVDANALRGTLGDEVEGAEVLVVSPAGNRSKIAFWVSDADDAIAEAEAAQEETVERLEEEGGDAAGDTGEAAPRRSRTRWPPSRRTASSSSPTRRATATTARTTGSPAPRSASASRSRTR